MVDVLATVEQKLIKLLEELDGHNLEQVKREMDDAQVGHPDAHKNTHLHTAQYTFGCSISGHDPRLTCAGM